MDKDFAERMSQYLKGIPTNSQGDGRVFANSVRNLLTYMSDQMQGIETNTGSGGSTGGVTEKQLSNVTLSYIQTVGRVDLKVTWDTSTFPQYNYATLEFQKATSAGQGEVNWNDIVISYYQTDKDANTFTISDVDDDRSYRVRVMGVSTENKRSVRDKAPYATLYVPNLSDKSATAPSSIEVISERKGVRIRWTQRADARYIYAEVRTNNSFGDPNGLITTSTGEQYVYVPSTRTGTIYLANRGADGHYSTYLNGQWVYPILNTPKAPVITKITDTIKIEQVTGEDTVVDVELKEPTKLTSSGTNSINGTDVEIKVTGDIPDNIYQVSVPLAIKSSEDQTNDVGMAISFQAPTSSTAMGTNVYVDGVKHSLDNTTDYINYYCPTGVHEVYIEYYDSIGESAASPTVTVSLDSNGPSTIDLKTVYAGDVKADTIQTNRLYINGDAHVATPVVTDSSDKVASTQFVHNVLDNYAESDDVIKKLAEKANEADVNTYRSELWDAINPFGRQRGTQYNLGDKVYDTSLGIKQYLECTTAGVTSTLDVAINESGVTQDGTVVWTTKTTTNKEYVDKRAQDLNNLVSQTKTNIQAGNVASATKLRTARKINGIAFDGTKDINIKPENIAMYVGGSNARNTNNSILLSQEDRVTDCFLHNCDNCVCKWSNCYSQCSYSQCDNNGYISVSESIQDTNNAISAGQYKLSDLLSKLVQACHTHTSRTISSNTAINCSRMMIGKNCDCNCDDSSGN